MHKHLFAAAAMMIAAATPAAAHIVLTEPSAAASAYYAGFFRVGHGCGESATVTLRIEMPAGIISARPQPKPGWEVEITREPLPAPIASEYGPITERVVAITWRGRLPADQFDQFGVLMKLPATGGPLYFPTVQTCETGERRWTDIPATGQAWHAVPNPAPILRVTAPAPRPAAQPAAQPRSEPDAHH